MSNEGPLQEMPCMAQSLMGSMLSHSHRSGARKKRGYLEDMLDTENTPSDLVYQSSPRHKMPCVAHLPRGKENERQFVLARRSRRAKESISGLSWDQLPDELLLRIFFCLPLRDLLRAPSVCKRWHRLLSDQSLWHSLDLEGATLVGTAFERVMATGVRRLRCPRAFIGNMEFVRASPTQVFQMDLTNCTVATLTLESILEHCRMLEHLSLEGLQLSDRIIHHLSQNPDMVHLNLRGCSGFSPDPLGQMLKSFSRMEQLNISWCEFNTQHVKAVVMNLQPSVTHLNVSGYRQNLTLEDLKELVARCPNIVTLDVSDSVYLTTDCIPTLAQLRSLAHLSLSRCYQIHTAALVDFSEKFPSLRRLDVFGLVSEGHESSLRKEMSHISINSSPISTVARPTPPYSDEPVMWNRRCRLRFDIEP